jgi:hypothetical protein
MAAFCAAPNKSRTTAPRIVMLQADKELRISKSTVQRVLTSGAAQPQLAAIAAIVWVHEKTAIEALDGLDPVLLLFSGRAERHGFEYGHGKLSLYAALNGWMWTPGRYKARRQDVMPVPMPSGVWLTWSANETGAWDSYCADTLSLHS